MDTKKFEALLNSTVVPAGLTAEEQLRGMEAILFYIKGRIPTKLYKYRNFCDNHISAFYKDQVWVSTAQSMNDGFDTRLYFDKKACVELYKQQTAPDKIAAFIKMMKTDAALRNAVSKLPGADAALQYLNLPDSNIQQGIEDSRNRVTPIIMEMLENLPVITQQALKFCCFSETVTSASMWGQYSDNERGFCIDYDFQNSETHYFTPSGSRVSTSLFPMICW